MLNLYDFLEAKVFRHLLVEDGCEYLLLERNDEQPLIMEFQPGRNPTREVTLYALEDLEAMLEEGSLDAGTDKTFRRIVEIYTQSPK